MFDELETFDQAYAEGDDGGPKPPPLRRRKTWQQQLGFYLTNLLILPLVAIAYLVISAHGLRQMMSVFATPLHKMPVPGAGFLKQWDGWNRADLGMVMALLLFVAVTYIWYRVFAELMGYGTFVEQRETRPALFYLMASVIGVMLLGDSAVFYFGLAARAASGWSDTPAYVPVAATILYAAGLALIGAWHADYHCSGTV